MDFAGFDWDSGNRKKCQKHGVSIAEFESLFDRPVVILPDKENAQSERRFRAIGTTSKKRNAFVVFTGERPWQRRPDTADQRPLHAQERGGEL
jgi:uncharacterized protein